MIPSPIVGVTAAEKFGIIVKKKERKKMKLELNGSELDILMISLIGRRNSIKNLLSIDGMSDNYYAGYREEMGRVDAMMERLMPGCVQRIVATLDAA